MVNTEWYHNSFGSFDGSHVLDVTLRQDTCCPVKSAVTKNYMALAARGRLAILAGKSVSGADM